MLMGLARGKLVVCLEVRAFKSPLRDKQAYKLIHKKGGYNLTSISKSALAVTRTLIGEKPDRMLDNKATDTGIDTVQMVAMHQSKFWPSLFPKDVSKGWSTGMACSFS